MKLIFNVLYNNHFHIYPLLNCLHYFSTHLFIKFAQHYATRIQQASAKLQNVFVKALFWS